MILLDVDPNLVRPGWTPLIILIVLAVVMALLFFSMRRQFRKIDLPTEQEARDEAASARPVPHD